MADLTITAANVFSKGGRIENGTCGETLTQGMPVYASAPGVYKKAAKTSATLAAAIGIVLTGGALNQPCVVQFDGPITIGATVEAGKEYVVGSSGGIRPIDDVTAGDFVRRVGQGTGTTDIELGFGGGTVAAGSNVA